MRRDKIANENKSFTKIQKNMLWWDKITRDKNQIERDMILLDEIQWNNILYWTFVTLSSFSSLSQSA